MSINPGFRLFSALLTVILCIASSLAQGGWRQWEMHLRDGTVVSANPLGLNQNGMFTRSMSPSETGIDRSKISYLAAGRRELPAIHSEKFKKDAVVLLDGSVVLGTIKFREIKFSEGTIVQNGKESTLENVAYIIFKQAKKK